MSTDAGPVAAPVGTHYEPPAADESSTDPEPVPDLEAGNATTNTPVLIPSAPQATPTPAPDVDLLDNQLPPQGPGTIDELD